MEEEKCMKR